MNRWSRPAARLAILVAAGLVLSACATPPKWRLTGSGPEPDRTEPRIEPHVFVPSKGEHLIGRLAVVRTREGDTLPDIARHFGLGHDAVKAANPGVDVWLPKADSRVVLPLLFILPDAPRQGIVVNLAAMRLYHYTGKNREIVTYPVGIGDEGRSTPVGEMFIERKAVRPTWYVPASIRRDHAKRGDPLPAEVPPGPDNPLGEYALYLSRASYVIHGTNKPYSIGLRATNGCLRLYPEHVEKLYKAVPVKTPVHIVNQPYLIGRSGGMLYLQAHDPHEELDAADLRKRLLARLRDIEKKEGLRVDWKRVEETVTQARGIPVPILEGSVGIEGMLASAAEIRRPAQLTGQPRIPAFKAGAWYVRADETIGEDNAKRLAAVLNHQGPQIPALVVRKGNRYQVLAGPFPSKKAAEEAARRIKSDLELDGVLVGPAQSRELAQKETGSR
ncbi:MAG: L,D-transpeptidase family protein [Syntrophaceae bacterium]|nr:L,D-transpeptidase family protein [Syntrophaceae bacterium]